MLRDAFDTQEPRPRIRSFSNHDAKINSAITVLGTTAMWLRSGAFQSDAVQSDAFDVGTLADEPMRLEVLYVNYGSTGWLRPPPVDAAELRENITTILANLPSIEMKLTP